MPDFSRDLDIGYPRGPWDILFDLIEASVVTVVNNVSVVSSTLQTIWQELVDTREWNTALNEELTDRLDLIRAEAGVNVVAAVSSFHSEFTDVTTLRTAQMNTVIDDIRELRISNADKGDAIVTQLQEGQEWDTELAQQVTEKLDDIRVVNSEAGASLVSKLETISDLLEDFDLSGIGEVLAELQSFHSDNIDTLEELIQEVKTGQEWDTALTEQVVEKLEVIRSSSVASSTSLGAKLDAIHAFAQVASNLETLHSEGALEELRTISAELPVLDDAIEELKRLRRAGELILGQDVKEG